MPSTETSAASGSRLQKRIEQFAAKAARLLDHRRMGMPHPTPRPANAQKEIFALQRRNGQDKGRLGLSDRRI